jgi:threonine/homoserine/homoserine lactone efflux protein
MDRVWIESLVLASGGIVSVGSITIVILLLISDGGWRKGAAYALGYTGGYTLIGIAAVLVGADASQSDSGGGGVSAILSMAVGLLLLWMSVRNARKAPSDSQDPPRIFTMLDETTARKAFGFGALVTVINFKNLAIFLSAVSVPVTSDLAVQAQLGIVVLDVLVFCASVILPILIYLSFPTGAEQRLTRFKDGLEARRRPIGIWLPAFFGLLFFLRGIRGWL